MGATMEATLVLQALNRALGHRQIEPDQLLIHTDQGSQFRAKGCCWDNAVVESFFSTLKHELDLDDDAEALFSTQQLQSRLAFWIDGDHNRERRHATIRYLSPIDDEQQYIAARTLTTARP